MREPRRNPARLAAVALLALPASAQTWQVAGPRVAVQLSADAAAGARLDHVRNPETAAQLNFDPNLAPSLWEVVIFDPDAPGTPRVLRATDPRQRFRVENCTGGVELCWDRVQLVGTSDRFDVRARIYAPEAGRPLDFTTAWEIDVIPENARRTRSRVFRVNFPIVAFDPLDQGLLTSDLLAGTATPQAVYPSTLLFDALGSQRYESVHPGKGDPVAFLQPLPPSSSYTDFHIPGNSGRQSFQFSNFRFYPYPGTSTANPLASELLWLGSDDASGWFKSYNLESVADPAPIPHAAFRWSIGHFAPLDPDPRENRSETFRSAYSARIGLRPYRGPEWWFDVVEPYRDWIRRRFVVPLGPIPRNPIFRRSSWDENSIFQGTVSYFLQFVPAPYPPGLTDAHLQASVKLARDYHAAFPDAPMNLLWQFTNERPIEPTTANSPPVFPGLGGYIDQVHQSVPESAVAYYHRYDLPVDEAPPAIDPSARFDYGVWNLDGSLRVRSDNGYPLMNFGAPEGRRSNFEKILLPFATQVGASGVLLDVLGGSGPSLSYGNWTATPKYLAHPPGGGDYWQNGKKIYAATAQALVKLAHWDRPAFVSTEHTEETLAGFLDVCGQQVGRTPYVDHRLFLPPLPLTGAGAVDLEPDVPFLPPLWNAIYHEFQPTAALNILHSVDWLATRGGPLLDNQFLELALYTHMVEFSTGNNPFNFLVTTDGDTGLLGGFGKGLFEIGPNGELLANDAFGTGVLLVERLRDLYRARAEHVAGPWLNRGRMERPLSVVRFRTALHPLRYLLQAQAHPFAPFLSYVRNIYPPAVYTLFPALSTYHSVWSAPAEEGCEDRKILCIVNWTDLPSDYALRVDAEELFPGGDSTLELYAIDLETGARTPAVPESVGSGVLDFGGNYGGPLDAVGLPAIPPRSTVLYELR